MPKENKALKIVRARAADACKRRDIAAMSLKAVETEIANLIAVERELEAAYQSKPKRAAKVKTSLPEARTGIDV